MNAVNDNNGTAVSRGLNIILLIVMTIVASLFILIAIVTLLLLLPSGMRESLFEALSVEVAASSPVNVAIASLGLTIMLGLYFFALYKLRKIIKTLMTGDPFVPENISRLRLIWIALALAEICRMIFAGLSNVSVTDISAVQSIATRGPIWLLVFFIAALAEVFRHGTELRRDKELTV